MKWHYVASHRKWHHEDVYEVREVYEDEPCDEYKEGSPLWTDDAVTCYGESKEELIRCLEMMLKDVKHYDVLELE